MQAQGIRGADIIAQTLARMGVDKVFSLSGNHIMPLYDALIDTPIDIIHVRHEAACVHMADAYARTTGQVGIAMVTGGQGHANGIAALFTSLASEAPMVLLSGHAGLGELGKGSFQELRQAEMAAPVAKASWTAQSAAGLGHDLAKAMQIARSGRPGPVHISLPFDLLEQRVDSTDSLWPEASASRAIHMPLSTHMSERIMKEISGAQRPLILCGPALCGGPGRALMARLEGAVQVPVIGMESPRGINDPSLGAFSEILALADLIVLLGKPLDFTLRFGSSPFIDQNCRFIVIDPDQDLIARVMKYRQDQLSLSTLADSASAADALLASAGSHSSRPVEWLNQVRAALDYRPPEWKSVQSAIGGPVHPLELCAVLQDFFARHPDATLVCDGGEIGQWPQAVVTQAKNRLINGVAGSIGPSLPFALAAKIANPAHPVVAVMGDGTFGFHMAEFDTAVRYGLPIIVIVGNDAKWNAEYQIQVRTYGKPRAQGCELLPARYDKVVEALGGHGEYVTKEMDLPAALERAFNSGKPACINVLIESVPAPATKRPA
ncbi:thiamine pyrophosphate-binding protein [Paralcaligenes sp. KSB-10]|uniref:thiamine pyrophosphate-binding protein n=1 Tax=Paralcaligenes sp. KSB-10 TaxID=2901142 RepID=UPI001E395811|nr:thiamine pyrophosphate-binding protein [Paralcaligenes sp. KSB-10]UHL62933.1 thiamine pyrophosphate-binding protein [Paralcaligenes sp. KSB-10]